MKSWQVLRLMALAGCLLAAILFNQVSAISSLGNVRFGKNYESERTEIGSLWSRKFMGKGPGRGLRQYLSDQSASATWETVDPCESEIDGQDPPCNRLNLSRKKEKSPPPTSAPAPAPESHPARYTMCAGIPHLRYKFVKDINGVQEALRNAKPGDLIEVKSGIYYQGSGPGNASLIKYEPIDDAHELVASNSEAKKVGIRAEKRGNGTDTDDIFMNIDVDLEEDEKVDDSVEALGGGKAPSPAPAPKPKSPSKGKTPMPAPSPDEESTEDTEDDVQNESDDDKGDEEDIKEEEQTDDDEEEEDGDVDVVIDIEDMDTSMVPTEEYEEEREEYEYYEDEDKEEDKDKEDDKDKEEDKDKDEEKSPGDDDRPSGGAFGKPWVAPTGMIDDLHGTEEHPITLCGPTSAVFDGSNGRKLASAAIRVVRSSHIRIKGFTMQNALKGLDIQKTNSSEFLNITTRYTLQEGIRIRYNSTYNLVQGSNISFTGRMWVGVGEGMYVGTSTRNSISRGLPQDHSNYNRIVGNYFGEGITAENIDLKEFTSSGLVANNTFNGSSIAGINGAIAWVAIKGNNYTIVDNRGSGTLTGGQGFRVLRIHEGLAKDNIISNNTCNSFEKGSYCVFIDPRAARTRVDCDNRRFNLETAGLLASANSAEPPAGKVIKASFRKTENLCNCDVDQECSLTRSNGSMFIRSLRPEFETRSNVKQFYTKSWSVENQFMDDLDEYRPLWD